MNAQPQQSAAPGPAPAERRRTKALTRREVHNAWLRDAEAALKLAIKAREGAQLTRECNSEVALGNAVNALAGAIELRHRKNI